MSVSSSSKSTVHPVSRTCNDGLDCDLKVNARMSEISFDAWLSTDGNVVPGEDDPRPFIAHYHFQSSAMMWRTSSPQSIPDTHIHVHYPGFQNVQRYARTDGERQPIEQPASIVSSASVYPRCGAGGKSKCRTSGLMGCDLCMSTRPSEGYMQAISGLSTTIPHPSYTKSYLHQATFLSPNHGSNCRPRERTASAIGREERH